MPDLAIAKGPRGTPASGAMGLSTAGLTGPDKAALILLSIDRAKAVDLLRSFDPAEAKILLAAADRLRAVGANDVDFAARDFETGFMSGVNFVGAQAEVRQLVTDAVGEEQPAQVEPEPVSNEETIWDRLSGESTDTLRGCLSELPAQAVAFVLSQLKAARVAEVLRAMPADDRNNMIERVLCLTKVSAEVGAVIEDAITRQLNAAAAKPASPYSRIAGILNQLDMALSQEAVDHLTSNAPEHAAAIRKLLFKFEQLPSLPKSTLAMVVDRTPVERTILALQGAPAALQNAVLGVMAPRTRRLAEAELQGTGSGSPQDIDGARRAIADAVLELVASGKVSLESEKAGAADTPGEADGQSAR